MLRRSILLLIAILLATGPAALADPAAPLLVVANEEVPDESLTLRQLQRIYLGKSTRWSGGLMIRPVLLQERDMDEVFITELLERSAENFSVYWKRMVFTGKGQPPRSFADAAALAAYLRETPGAIGFLPPEADLSGLKIMALD